MVVQRRRRRTCPLVWSDRDRVGNVEGCAVGGCKDGDADVDATKMQLMAQIINQTSQAMTSRLSLMKSLY